MRTTLDIDEKLLAQVVELTGEKSRSKAASRVLEEYVRVQRVEALRAMLGNFDLDYDIGERKRLDAEREAKLDRIREAYAEGAPTETE